jgi:serine/threonine protein kinase
MMPPQVLAPQSIFAGQFRIVALIARGGMGVIYHVEQLPTGHPRALKVILPEYAQDPKLRARFEQEARIAAHIESEHVAQVIAAGVDAETNTPWLAMELLQGRDLATVLGERQRLPPSEVAVIMQQLGHALSAAHRIGVVHRDLKPENIFIATSRRSDASFTVKVLDFGVAKWAQESRPGQATAVVGSPLWMAPEQLDARGILGPHTDIWPLGLLAYAMLTGRSYWRGADGQRVSLPEVVGEIMAAPLVPASQRAAEQGLGAYLPPGFDAWFARCVERDGAMRHRTVDACIAELLPMLGAPAVPALSTPFQPSVAASIPPTVAIPAMSTPQQGSGNHAAHDTVAWSPGPQGFPLGPSPFPGTVQPVQGSFGPPLPTSTAAVSSGPFVPQPQGAFASSQGSFAPPQPPLYGAGPGHGSPSPWHQPTPPKRTAASGLGWVLGLTVGAFLLLCAGATATYFVFAPSCERGMRRSDGHCCPEGSHWNRAQRACVSQATATYPSNPPAPSPSSPDPYLQPTLTPLPPSPSTDPSSSPLPAPSPPAPSSTSSPQTTFTHACDGVWTGPLEENTGAHGTMDLVVRTSSPLCARWTEYWQSGARCLYNVARCRMTANGIQGTGRSVSPRCTPTVSMSVTCSPTSANFREQVGAVIDTASLARR